MKTEAKRVFIIVTCGPESPDRCTAPFFFAQKAARLGAQVRICFILHGALLLKEGVAEKVYANENGRPVRDFIDAALQAGVELFACDAALKMNGMTPADLIQEADNLVGPNFLITQGLESDLVLNF